MFNVAWDLAGFFWTTVGSWHPRSFSRQNYKGANSSFCRFNLTPLHFILFKQCSNKCIDAAICQIHKFSNKLYQRNEPLNLLAIRMQFQQQYLNSRINLKQKAFGPLTWEGGRDQSHTWSIVIVQNQLSNALSIVKTKFNFVLAFRNQKSTTKSPSQSINAWDTITWCQLSQFTKGFVKGIE